MGSIAGGFDAANGYKRIAFREDRDLLDTELNELQEIAIHERTALMDRLFAPGSIIAGLEGSVNGDTVTLPAGRVYLDGHAVSVPEATLECTDPGVQTIWLDVFRRIATVADDPALVNPLTGEPTAEREKWIATLQTRNTSGDPLPEGASGRTVVALYTLNRDTGELLPVVPRVAHPDDPVRLAAHLGQGGTAQHPVVTATDAGFMAPGDKTKLDQLSSTTPPDHTHDARYYPRADADALLTGKAPVVHQHDATYAPLAHLGTGGTAHAIATGSQAGFLSAADKGKLDQLSTTTPPAHTHDDRYYTEAEVTAQLATRAPLVHAHDAAYAPLVHVGAGGVAHTEATSEQAGFLSTADKDKLDAIAPGATVAHRTATLVIAAADTSPAGQAAADAVCSGQYTVDPRTGDQDVINAALATVAALPGGGTVLLLEGTYQITAPIALLNHTRLVGVGLSTRLYVPAGYAELGTFAVMQNADRTDGNQDVAVLDLTIDGGNINNTSAKLHGIDWWGVARGTIARVYLQKLDGHGIKLGGDSGAPTWFTTIRDTTVDTCQGFGLWLTGTGWMNAVTGCLILRTAGDAGVRLSGMGDTLISHNRIYYNAQHGLELSGACAHLTVAQNLLAHNGIAADNTYSNLRVTLADHCLIQGNTCRRYLMGSDLDQPKYGIHVVAGQQNFVTGNHLYEAGKTADLLDSGTATHLHANVTSAGLQNP